MIGLTNYCVGMDRKPLSEIKMFGEQRDDHMRVHTVIPAGANPLGRPDDPNIRLAASKRTAEGDTPLGQMDYNSSTGTIDSIHVDPEHRRQGVAKDMISFGRQLSQQFDVVHPTFAGSTVTDRGRALARSVEGSQVADNLPSAGNDGRGAYED